MDRSMIVPRKLVYQEDSYFGMSYLIKLHSAKSISLQKSAGGTAASFAPIEICYPSELAWTNFKTKIQSFNFKDIRTSEVLDGCCTDVWVTYYKRIKFSYIFGDEPELDLIRNIFNPITICEEYPKGLFNSNL